MIKTFLTLAPAFLLQAESLFSSRPNIVLVLTDAQGVNVGLLT